MEILDKFFSLCNKKKFNNEYDKGIYQGKLFEKFVSSIISGNSLENVDEYLIDENNAEIKGMDLCYFSNETLYLIQAKARKNIKSQDYAKSKLASEQIENCLKDDSLSSKEKNKKTGIKIEIIEKLAKVNFIFTVRFIFVYTKTEQELNFKNWNIPGNAKDECMSIEYFLKFVLKNIHNGKRINKGIKHVFNIDEKNNLIKHRNYNNDEGVILKVKLNELIGLIVKEEENGNKIDSLFEGNVREEVKKTNISKEIIDSLENEKENFFLLNNGITMIVSNLKYDEKIIDKVIFKDPNIINGQQTMRTLYNHYLSNKKINSNDYDETYVLVRIYKLVSENLMTKLPFSTNNQNKIEIKDLLSLEKYQLNIKSILIDQNIYYEIKNGNSIANSLGRYFKNRISAGELLKLFTICFDNLVSIKNKIGKMNNQIYNDISSSYIDIKSPFYNTESIIRAFTKSKNNEYSQKILKMLNIYFLFKSKIKKNLKLLKFNSSRDLIFYTLFNFFQNENDIEKEFDIVLQEALDTLNKYFEYLIKEKNITEANLFKKESFNDLKEIIKRISLLSSLKEKKIMLKKELLNIINFNFD
ncbi:AIPR family protein [Spiroplasma cantharicola]|uniref:Abortive phage infection protein C-terminal domain-containing protein n=1 Tax=Spiroplasma cantharicola TaxID=362837 RepID=A0A0M4KCS3_9MOLU|nr:AIPR family protein [Spiroplasma cantharicola]ALD66577.1 hypothetical protein SCANT_v1c06710 [Spiroplasma cantharicola]